MGYIKGVLIMIFKDLEEQAKDQRSNKRFAVLVKEISLLRLKKFKFKQFTKDKLKVYLKHLAHYILLQNI